MNRNHESIHKHCANGRHYNNENQQCEKNVCELPCKENAFCPEHNSAAECMCQSGKSSKFH